MRKLLVLLLLLMTTKAYSNSDSQNIGDYVDVGNATPPRIFAIYLEGNSGTFTSDTTGLFSGNEFIFGISYLHGFINAPWLRMGVKLEALGGISFNYINLNRDNIDSGLNPNFQFNGYDRTTVGFDKLEAGLYFSDYFYIGMEHSTQINLRANYSLGLPFGQYLEFSSGVDVLPFLIGTIINPNDPNFEAEGTVTSNRLKEFFVGIKYGVGFGRGWGFNTGLELLSDGSSFDVGTQGQAWEIDSLEAFRSNLRIRWNNTIQYRSPSGFYVWGQLRFEANRLIPNPAGISNNELYGRTNYDVNMRFGLGYVFDFAKLVNQES